MRTEVQNQQGFSVWAEATRRAALQGLILACNDLGRVAASFQFVRVNCCVGVFARGGEWASSKYK
jgi:hypothetical protein